MDIAAEFMAATINAFEANKRLADRAVERIQDHKLHTALDASTNSIAAIMKHVAGNLISRWTDFLTTDGGQPTQNAGRCSPAFWRRRLRGDHFLPFALIREEVDVAEVDVSAAVGMTDVAGRASRPSLANRSRNICIRAANFGPRPRNTGKTRC